MVQHSYLCTFPEGCSCGASAINAQEAENMAQFAKREWARGYFCAVAIFLRENFSEGYAGTEATSLFKGCSDWRLADPEDIETFKAHGLIPH